MKRILAIILSLALSISCCCSSAFAATISEPRASLTLSNYNVTLDPGNSSKEISFTFYLYASKTADSIGVETIKIYKSNGSLVKTITGTTGNGLISTNDFMYVDSYDCLLTSGVSYYAEVTIFARLGSTSDSRTITTATVTAP